MKFLLAARIIRAVSSPGSNKQSKDPINKQYNSNLQLEAGAQSGALPSKLRPLSASAAWKIYALKTAACQSANATKVQIFLFA